MEPRSYEELLTAWRGLAARLNFVIEEFPVGNPERRLCSIKAHWEQPTKVMIAAGVHGDEPVTPWALLQAVEEGVLDPHFGYRLWCCTNPTGYARGTRRNSENRDINRSYIEHGPTIEAAVVMAACRDERYALLIDMHEDYEAEGMYLYEPLVDGTAPLGRAMLDAVVEAGYPLQVFSAAFDLGYHEESADEVCKLEAGRVIPDVQRECEHFADGLPLTMCFLQTGWAHRSLTVETPRRFAWDDRMTMHRIALTQALAGLKRGLA